MILRSSARQPKRLLSALSSCTSTPYQAPPFQCIQSRQKHNLPSIGVHNDTFVRDGVPGLFSQQGFQTAWTDYQTHLLEKLDTMLAGDPRENHDVKTLLLETAREPSMAALFNNSSMAHNQHFYFSSLSPTATSPPSEMLPHISHAFSSLDTLRATFLATANAMFGPGFVWLVQQHDPPATHPTVDANYGLPSETRAGTAARRAVSGALHAQPTVHLRILTTYLAGSPYPGAHARQQGRDLNTENLASDAASFRRQTRVQNSAGAFGAHAAPRRGAGGGMESVGLYGAGDENPARYGGADCVPLLCVSTWEHAWLPDWGPRGKAAYLERWWERVDWDLVWQRCWTGPSR